MWDAGENHYRVTHLGIQVVCKFTPTYINTLDWYPIGMLIVVCVGWIGVDGSSVLWAVQTYSNIVKWKTLEGGLPTHWSGGWIYPLPLQLTWWAIYWYAQSLCGIIDDGWSLLWVFLVRVLVCECEACNWARGLGIARAELAR